jgi:hypothetical protein
MTPHRARVPQILTLDIVPLQKCSQAAQARTKAGRAKSMLQHCDPVEKIPPPARTALREFGKGAQREPLWMMTRLFHCSTLQNAGLILRLLADVRKCPAMSGPTSISLTHPAAGGTNLSNAVTGAGRSAIMSLLFHAPKRGRPARGRVPGRSFRWLALQSCSAGRLLSASLRS